MNSVLLLGKFYGQYRTNLNEVDENGNPSDGKGPWISYSVGVYNSYKRGVEFFPCLSFGPVAKVVHRFHQPKRWVAVTGSLRHDKRKAQGGKEYPDYKVQVFSIDVPTLGVENEADGGGDRAAKREGAGSNAPSSTPPPSHDDENSDVYGDF